MTYSNDEKLSKLINLAKKSIKKFNENNEIVIPIRLDYAKKREMDRSSLYSIDGPFQLMHVDIANLEFLGESATTPRYALLAIDMYSSKVYVYPTHSQK